MANPPKYPTSRDVKFLKNPLESSVANPDIAPSPEVQAVWNTLTSMGILPQLGESGWTVSVPPKSIVEGTVPSVEHYPYIWIDVYTGESLNDTRYPWGRAQQYGSGDIPDTALDGRDFVRLADVQGLRVRLSTSSGSPGTCSITLQNALVGKESDGTWRWERVQFKSGRFQSGQRIRYLHRFPDLLGEGRLWYGGKLVSAISEVSADIALEGVSYNIIWDEGLGPPVLPGLDYQPGTMERVINTQGQETWITAKGTRRRVGGRLDPNCLFAETAGEPIFEPMQKIKIFGMNRFSLETLRNFGYEPYSGPGGEKTAEEEGQQVTLSKTPSGEKPIQFRPRQTTVNGESVSEENMLQYSGEASFYYATAIFTGYINEVVNEQQGPNWGVTITATDVTCWLDYSMLNVDPSINIFNADFILDAEKQHFMIYTSRFETMPAHEIVKALYLGLTEVYVTAAETITNFDLLQVDTMLPDPTRRFRETALKTGSVTGAYIYSTRNDEERFRLVGDSKQPLVLPTGTRLSIYGEYEEGGVKWYYVSTSAGYSGFIKASDVGKPAGTYSGLAHFKLIENPAVPLVPIGLSTKEIKDMFVNDKLLINPAIEPTTDPYVMGAYQRYLRTNWPLVQSEYVSKRSILNLVVKQSNCECYADGDGRVLFHPVRAYQSVTDPVYIIHPEETVSWSFVFSDREIVTWVHVHGEWEYGAIPGEWLYGQVFEDWDMVKRFGVRSIQVPNTNIRNREGARAYARSLLKRINANKVTGTVTIIFRPEIQLARTVYIPWLNAVGYVASIDHNVQWGRTALTTLSLKYVRHPWTPWSPLIYDATAESDQLTKVTAEQNPERGRKLASKESGTRTSYYNIVGPPSTFSLPNMSNPLGTDESESKHEMRDYVHRAFLEAASAVHQNLGARCSVFKARDSSGTDLWKGGTALKVDIDTMNKPDVPGKGYEKAAIAANLNLIIATFREVGFRVINNYRSTTRWEAVDVKGHLVLIYSNIPPSDVAPEES